MKTIKINLEDKGVCYISTNNIDYMVGDSYSIIDITLQEGKEIDGIGKLRVLFDTETELDSVIGPITDEPFEELSTSKEPEPEQEEQLKPEDAEDTLDSLNKIDFTDFEADVVSKPGKSGRAAGETLIEEIIQSSFVDLEKYSSKILEITKYYRVNTYVTEKIYKEIQSDEVPKQEEVLWRHGDTNASNLS